MTFTEPSAIMVNYWIITKHGRVFGESKSKAGRRREALSHCKRIRTGIALILPTGALFVHSGLKIMRYRAPSMSFIGVTVIRCRRFALCWGERKGLKFTIEKEMSRKNRLGFQRSFGAALKKQWPQKAGFVKLIDCQTFLLLTTTIKLYWLTTDSSLTYL